MSAVILRELTFERLPEEHRSAGAPIHHPALQGFHAHDRAIHIKSRVFGVDGHCHMVPVAGVEIQASDYDRSVSLGSSRQGGRVQCVREVVKRNIALADRNDIVTFQTTRAGFGDQSPVKKKLSRRLTYPEKRGTLFCSGEGTQIYSNEKLPQQLLAACNPLSDFNVQSLANKSYICTVRGGGGY